MSLFDFTEAQRAARVKSRSDLSKLKQRETEKLCDRAVAVQTSRRWGDLDADLDALEEQAAIVRGLL